MRFALVLLVNLCFSDIFSKRTSVVYRVCDESSICVDITQCPVLYKRFVLKISKRLMRVPRRYSCGPSQSRNRMVCCPNTELSSIRQVSVNPAEILVEENPETILQEDNSNNIEPNQFLPMDICGLISPKTRIMSGEETDPGEFPWMALLAYRSEQSQVFRCGATILNERFILTAAHCIDSTLIGVRLGEHNLETVKDCDSRGQNCQPPAEDFTMDSIRIHPEYNSSTFLNDIALIQLAKAANFSYSNLKPICLPFGNLLYFDLINKNVTVAGWGGTEKGTMSTILRKVELPVMSQENCKRLYDKIKPIQRTQICAGARQGHDSCAGDSGGPLNYLNEFNGNLRYVQYGIVSYGPKICGVDGLPGVYTDVRYYLDWILSILNT